MHTPPVDRSRRPAPARRKAGATGTGGSLFASHLAGGNAADSSADGLADESAAPGSSAAVGVSPLGALLGTLQIDAGRDPAAQRATVRYASDLLDRLELVRRDVLDGRIPAERLTELARALREDRQRSQDPVLDDIVEEVELRAEVELAKLRRAR